MADQKNQSLFERLKSLLLSPFKRGQAGSDATGSRRGGSYNKKKNKPARSTSGASGGSSRFGGANAPAAQKSDRAKAKSRKVQPKK